MSDGERKVYSFGEFRFVGGDGVLFRGDRRVGLRPQAATVLEALLQRPGALVSRAELQDILWSDTVVDAEAGLNHCVRQVRRALGDHATNPRFVATEPRRGYRFVGQVELVDEQASAVTTPMLSVRRLARVAAMLVLLLAAGAAFLYQRPSAREVASSEVVPRHVFADYERARYLLRQPGLEPASRAVPLLERVTRQAPDFAPGHAALARAVLQSDPFTSGQPARRHVQRALELAPTLSDALVVRGDIRSLVDHDWQAAARDFERARKADPTTVEALHHHAGVLALLGRHDEAIGLMGQAVALDPVSPLLAGDLAWFHFAARDWGAARFWAQRTLELDPTHGTARSVLLHASAQLGDAAEVLRQTEAKLREAGAPPDVIATVVAAPRPLSAYWQWWSDRLTDTHDPVSRVHRAIVHVALDRPGDAFDDLEAAAAARYRMLPFHLADPRFDTIRDHPRFAALLARHGLPNGRPDAVVAQHRPGGGPR